MCLLAASNLCSAASGIKQSISGLIWAFFIEMLLLLDWTQTLIYYSIKSFCLNFAIIKESKCVFSNVMQGLFTEESLKISYVTQRAYSAILDCKKI